MPSSPLFGPDATPHATHTAILPSSYEVQLHLFPPGAVPNPVSGPIKVWVAFHHFEEDENDVEVVHGGVTQYRTIDPNTHELGSIVACDVNNSRVTLSEANGWTNVVNIAPAAPAAPPPLMLPPPGPDAPIALRFF